MQLLEVVAGRAHLPHQRLPRRQHALARCRIGRGVSHCLHRREELLHQRRQAALLVGEQVVDLGDLVRVRRQRCAGRGGAAQLAGQELVIDADHRGGVGAEAIETLAGVLAAGRGHDGILARIAFGRRIGKIVAGRRQRVLRGVQAGKTNTEERHCALTPD
ncbi:hypothetical protein D3C72_1397910 [compost metagenome]